MRNLKMLSVLLFSLFFCHQIDAQSIFGTWKTIDDETGKPKSIVEIFEKDGKAYGKIIKLYREPTENQDPICDKCTDDRKDKKILGMEIIREMIQDDDEWEDGTIMDPKKGTIYDCKMWVEDNNLQVRGYIAFFFRTQTWLPYQE
jgi:uncharacterized protein (DUF2147 family)